MMANDYQGEVKDFALVVPVPVILQADQVSVGTSQIIERLDAFSAPRLVEYFDPNPCETYYQDALMRAAAPSAESSDRRTANTLGVTVEEQFTVGEYDIVMLSAKESSGLTTWLTQNGYKIPRDASELLRPYIRQNLKFFVAKVNLEKFANAGFQKLRPLMMAYESPKFMLPIRLGMTNAQGEQDLIVYLLSPQGQVELTNYRTVKIPSDVEIPEFVQNEFPDFYKALFQTAHQQEAKKAAFLEYAWDMGGCDPCAAEPLTPDELQQAGVFWLQPSGEPTFLLPASTSAMPAINFRKSFSFMRQPTVNFSRVDILGEANCQAARAYQRSIRDRQERQAQTLT